MGKFIRLSIHDSDNEYDVEFTSTSDNVEAIRAKVITFLDNHLGLEAATRRYKIMIGNPLMNGDRVKRIKTIREITHLGLKDAKEADDSTDFTTVSINTRPMVNSELRNTLDILRTHYQVVQVTSFPNAQ